MTRCRPAKLRPALAAGLLDPLDLAPPDSISEREFTSLVIAAAQSLVWRVYHPRPALQQSGRWCTPVAGDGVGYPDLTLVRDGKLLFIELKASKGRLSDDQRHWLAALGSVPGVTAAVARPSDWAEVVRLLRGQE